MSKPNASAWLSSTTCTARSHSGPLPDAIAFQRSRRWKSAFFPFKTWASSQRKLALPCFDFQCHLMSLDVPSSVTIRKVWTPKPSWIWIQQCFSHNRRLTFLRTYHVTVRADNTKARHGPHECVKGRGLRTKEVPSRVVGSGRLRYFVIWTRLHRMNEIRELNSVLNEENWDIIANNIWELLVVRTLS